MQSSRSLFIVIKCEIMCCRRSWRCQEDLLVQSSPGRLPVGFRIIGIFKLATAVLSLALGFGLLRLFRADVREGLEPLVRGLRLDPENRFVHRLILGLANIDRRRL